MSFVFLSRNQYSALAIEITKRSTMQSYKKIISRLDSFDKLISEDKTNLTCTDRSIYKYNSALNTHVDELVLELAKKKGRKINILDAGCGNGSAIHELLSDRELNDAIDTCTGVSVSYFEHIKEVSRLHGDRFIYYKGKVEDVLKEQKNQYDIILDVWGAFSYSPYKLEVLELYYQALTLNGEARILSPDRSTLKIKSDIDGEVNLKDFCFRYPNLLTFKSSRDSYNHTINVTKTTVDLHFPKYKLESFEETSALNGSYDIETLRTGNALCPTNIIYTSLFTSQIEATSSQGKPTYQAENNNEQTTPRI